MRTELEKLRGERALLADRIDQALVTVSLSPVERRPVAAPHAKFYPGVSAAYAAYFVPGRRPTGFYGPGFSLQLARFVHFDLAVLRGVDAGRFSADAILASMGGEAYSDFLGQGKRTVLNPYFGFNLGWARFRDADFAALGATAGVEVLKTTLVLVDLAVDARAVFNWYDLRMAVVPKLTLSLAF